MRTVIKDTVRALCIGTFLLFSITACAGEEYAELETPEAGQEQNKPEDMTEEEKEIMALLERRNQAMIDRDVETLSSLMADDLILTHITGATQTKQEWLDEIAAESMRYYAIEMQDLSIRISGNQATATYVSVIEARIWGSHGTWRLNSNMALNKTDKGWLWCNRPSNSNK